MTLISNVHHAQFKLQGTVKNQNIAIENCVVTLLNQQTITNKNGNFLIENIAIGENTIKFQHVGFEILEMKINFKENLELKINLIEKVSNLKEVLVQDVARKIDKTIVNQTYIQKNNQGSLMKSLENLPGINAVGVGVQASKPIVRGMSFTRVAVLENGFKHEGQQWGADHGLEIESNQVDSVELLKGVDALLYGSDAVGGVIKINSDKKPFKNGFSGNFTTIGNSVNNGLNIALNLNYSNENWFFKIKNSWSDFGDYNLPTNQIVYLTQIIPIENQRLKNTAGQEKNYSNQIVYAKNNFSSSWTLSFYDLKMGFFPGAHGIPSPNRVKDDFDSRNIDFPRQEVTHFKILGKNQWKWLDNSIEILTGFQQNVRKELSFFHSHYPSQPIPVFNPELELYFNLKTYDFKANFQKKWNKNEFTLSFETQLQNNLIDGYQFLLPNFQRKIFGVTSSYQMQWNEKWQTKFGLRFDLGNYAIERYFDANFYNYLIEKGNSNFLSNDLATRSKGLNKVFNALNYGITTTIQSTEKSKFTQHIGSVFRFPTVMELAANGVHHGSFRHEKGNENIEIEKGINTELNYYFKHNSNEINTNVYFFYFNNFLFLQPSGVFSILPHSGQTYQYTQSKAIMSGVELQWRKTWQKWQSNLVLELLQNQEISSGFGLPFFPASNAFYEINYYVNDSKYFANNSLQFSIKHSLEQKNIAQNEDFSKSWTLLNFGYSTELNIFNTKITTRFSIYNLLNTKYFNHTSFYRPLEIPEQGRNFQLSFSAKF